MKKTRVVDIVTKDNQETFDVEDLVGQDAPYAYHINYGNNGFAKFKIDPKSLRAFESSLNKIENSLDRRHLFIIMNDMLKDNDISGA